ncbi:MAG: efflux transporter outer membrane subunit [SAR324 cluster bacterium]|uniref:Efflux transporter outer membrane subunit n=1 Tax=SAR324 cluster bacterium TaxID=2024889 RepID=A0A7X9FSE9_9DELT|nr:efflux transporter outer membrane subunit [SAR324 cluster bacterium]
MNRSIVPKILICFLIGGCTLAPSYKRPESPVPSSWPSGTAYQSVSTDDAPTLPEIANLPWQSFFKDERLQKVIDIALSNNRDLRIAALNVERVRALYRVQRSELPPVINTDGNFAKSRNAKDFSNTGEATTGQSYSVNLGVSSWEIDFFGRIQSLTESALEEYFATEEARRAAQIALISQTANTYLAVAAERERLALAQSTYVAQQATADLIKRRFGVGLANELELRQAQSRADAARVDVALYTRQLAQVENALTYLLGGQPVATELMLPDLSSFKTLPEISAGISSEALLNRPDILEAERRLRAVNANIGAARAALFPRIILTTSIGTASAELSNLFSAGADTWNFAPHITIPIFDPRAWSALDVIETQQKMAVAQYEKAIQTAFREVSDTLATRGTIDEQLAAQKSLTDSVAEMFHIADLRYNKGIDSYLTVLDAQRSLYAAQQAYINLRLIKLENQVRLYAVLGGGGVIEKQQQKATGS